MTFSWLATLYQMLIYSNLILHNIILVSKNNYSVYNNFTRHEQVLTWRDKLIILWTLNRQTKLFLRNSPIFKLFAFLQIRQVENMRMNLRQYQTHNVVQNSESQPKGLHFSKGIFSGRLYSVPFIIERLSFQMRRLEKEWFKQLGVGTY